MELESIKVSQLESWDVVFGSTRLLFGKRSLDRLGEMANRLGARRVLLVTDPGNREAGHASRAKRSLIRESIAVETFDGVVENPTTAHVEDGRRIAAAHEADCIVGLGGGSAMDCAKGINFVLTNGGVMGDYKGYARTTRPLLPSIGIPATAGTGSEAQSYALISDERTDVKMACGTPDAMFRTVILDPIVAASVPREVAAVTGVDAVSHAIESYVCTKRNPLSQMFGREAWGLLEDNLPQILSSPGDLDAWGRMLVGAFLAGAAIEHSMLGAAHACANPLTARFDITHGKAVGLMLPHVMHFNAQRVGDLYREMQGPDQDLLGRFLELRAAAGLPESLRDCGVDRETLPTMAREAREQWTAGFNPRPVGEKELQGFYEAAY